MARKIFTVTHADGTVSKRTSESRTYTHAVEVGTRRSTTVAREEAAVAEMRQRVATLEAALADGTMTRAERPWWGGTETYVTVSIGGEYAGAWVETLEGEPKKPEEVLDVEAAKASIASRIEQERHTLARYEDRARLAERGPEIAWTVLSWSSSAALAEKASRSARHDVVRVVAVD